MSFYRNVSELGEHVKPERIGGDLFDALDKAVGVLEDYAGSKKIEKRVWIVYMMKDIYIDLWMWRDRVQWDIIIEIDEDD